MAVITTLSNVLRGTFDTITPPKIDWAQVMEDLHNNGCTAFRVARSLGIADCTARNWAKGGEPGYGYGRALLRLHSAYCGAGLTTLRVHEGEVVA